MPCHIFFKTRSLHQTQLGEAVHTGHVKAKVINPFALCARSCVSAWRMSEMEPDITILSEICQVASDPL